jgi:hypothetical protein
MTAILSAIGALPEKEAFAMRSSIAIPIVVLMALWGLVVPAHAGSISGTFAGSATLTPTSTSGVDILNFTGNGSDTTFGSDSVSLQSTIDFTSPPHFLLTNTTLREVFSGGTLMGTGSGIGINPSTGTSTFSIAIEFTGGTGIFGGVTGGMILHARMSPTSSTTETISLGNYTGALVLDPPAVPEPGTLALLVPAVSLGAVVVVRQRRRKPLAH